MNFFWSIYKNLENELIDLSRKIHFCDKQESVYSVHISDLLIRTSVEIEALSKELYKIAGGNMNPLDSSGNSRDLYFDTDCIQFLDLNWKITKKVVDVVSPNFYFSKSENLILRPLKNCNKHGEGRWKKAYQAVKHNRVQSLEAGNIANLIRAMAALYLLNIYYRNEKYDLGTVIHTSPFDSRLGSEIFAVHLAEANLCTFADEMSDDSIANSVKSKLESAVLIQKFTEKAFMELHQGMMEYNSSASDMLSHSPEVARLIADHPEYKIKSFLSLAKDAGGDELVNKIMQGQRIARDLKTAHLEVVLNKGQQIYPVLKKST